LGIPTAPRRWASHARASPPRLAYYDGYRGLLERPAGQLLLQAQRDYFGAHRNA
jgi:6-phosphogluconate dehydrogenase